MSLRRARLAALVGAALLAVAAAACKSAPVEPAPTPKAPELARERPEGPPGPRAAEAPPRCVDPLPPLPVSTVPPAPIAPVLDARCPREPGPARRFRKRPLRVGAELLTVELAQTEAEREQGLMYRRALGEAEGMLFDLGAVDRHAFWMHDTCIPLDIGFLDADGVLVGVAENAPPLNDAPRSVRCPSRYVLEVPSGWYRRHGVLPGARIDFAGE